MIWVEKYHSIFFFFFSFFSFSFPYLGHDLGGGWARGEEEPFGSENAEIAFHDKGHVHGLRLVIIEILLGTIGKTK